MVSWPELGTRVTVRYRRPAGSDPPLTDAVGHLLDVSPLVRVQTKTGAVVQFAPDQVVALRSLSDRPVRASEIRALEHVAALAWPSSEERWLDGWLLRAGDVNTWLANSAVPLDRSATTAAIPSIAGWYRRRGLTPRLLIPERLLRFSSFGEQPNRMLVRDVHIAEPDPSVTISSRGDTQAIGSQDQARAAVAVSDASDGTRWVGLSATPSPRLCEALLAWGATRGATRGHVRVAEADHDAMATARFLGFAVHHHAHYVTPAT